MPRRQVSHVVRVLSPLLFPYRFAGYPKMELDSSSVTPGNILCVSPNDRFHQRLDEVFSNAGYGFAPVPDGADALQHAPDGYDLLLIDLAMPDLSAFALCCRWRAQDHYAPILHFASVPIEGYNQLVHACPDCFARPDAEPADVLEAARALIATHRVERALDHYLEAAPDATVLVDRHGTIVRVNAQLEALFGYARSELFGRAVECLMPVRYHSTHAVHREHYDKAPTPRPMGTGMRLVGRRKDASEFAVDVALSPVGGYRAAAIRDVTAQQSREAELRRHSDALKAADQLKDQALAFVAHELRTPLSALMTTAGVLAHDTSSYVGQRTAPVLLRQISHMARLVDDLLDVTRARTGQLHLQLEVCDLKSVITGAIEICGPTLRSRHHTLTVDVPDTPVLVHCDSGRLRQVVVNLVSNAVKFTQPGGRIDVALSRSGADAVIVVEDSGVGIARERLPHVFALFSGLATDHQSRDTGVGLGLALSRQIVTLHHGEITASSDGVGCGSAFSVRVPLWIASPATA